MTAKKPEKQKKCWRGRPSPDGLSRKHEDTVRLCIVTQETLPVDKLVRFCVAPDGLLVPDLAHKLPGRGIWVSADKDVIETACRKNLFTKAARRKTVCPENMDELIKKLFVRRLQSLLGVAKKAGLVTAGFEKVAEALRKGQVFCLIEAVDAAEDGREKLRRLCAGIDISVVRILTADQAAEALGTGVCVHAALKSGGISDLFVAEARRFAAYCKTELC
ncbi:MAG: RNA-binding protein [Alphaproteobacteria bacterium]|nr:RNA-binding protein [Alphaproteobacteria bacterium]